MIIFAISVPCYACRYQSTILYRFVVDRGKQYFQSMQLKWRGKKAVKRFKKLQSKRKLNGKKGAPASKMKQKSEMESPAKEPISELEKEILVIQIHKQEGKLKRKMHLCSYLEEEASLYKALYKGKLFLKSESMQLLNGAFQDFVSEIFLLDQEYASMKSVHSNLVLRQHFCTAYQKRVDMLNALGTKLEENLLESEKCFDELPEFTKIFSALKQKAVTGKEKHDCLKKEILRHFDGCLWRIQNQVNLKAGDVIHDRDLNLNLLPPSWQTLFCSGWFSRLWLESSSAHLEYLQSQNEELEKNQDGLLQPLQTDNLDKNDNREKPEHRIPSATPEEAVQDLEIHQQYLYLEVQNMHQQNKMKSMKSEMSDLEKAIQSLEVSGINKSYLIQIVHKAGSLLRQEFETDGRTFI